jgi:hypothetical protein
LQTKIFKKSKKFVLQDNNRGRNWPNEKILHIYTYISPNAKVPSETKLFVSFVKKDSIRTNSWNN